MSRHAKQATSTTRVHSRVHADATRRAGELTAELGETVPVTEVISIAASRGLASVTAADVRRRRPNEAA